MPGGPPANPSGNPQPLGGNEMPRFAGITTFMRLPNRSAPAGCGRQDGVLL